MLQKQIAPLQFRGGIDSKTDEKAVLPGKLLTLENATFSNPGRLNKRNGYRALPREVENDGDAGAVATGVPANLSNGQGLVSYKDELLAFDKRSLYSRSVSSDSWIWKGVLPSCSVTQTQVSSSVQSASTPDAAQHPSGMRVFVWVDAEGIRYSVMDASTGQRIVASRLLAAGPDVSVPKVVVVGNNFSLYYVNAAGDLMHGSLSVGDPTAPVVFSTLLSFVTDSVDSLREDLPRYDVKALSGGVYLVFANDGIDDGGTLKRYAINSPTTLLGSVYWTDFTGSVCVFEDHYSSGPVVAFASTAGGSFVARFRSYATTIIDGAGADALLGDGVWATDGNPFASVTGASRSAAARDIVLYASTFAPPTLPSFRGVRANTVSGNGFTIGAEADFLRSVSLAADAFVRDGTTYVPLNHHGAERTTFIADDGRNIVAKAVVGTSGLGAEPNLPSVFANGDTAFGFAALSASDTDGTTDVNEMRFGVAAVDLDLYDNQRSYRTTEISDSLHVGGGIVWQYDGVSPVELGFHVRLPELDLTDTGVNFSYLYCVVPEWVDAQGFRHFGAPSIPTRVNLADAISTGDTHIFGITTIRLTAKRNDLSPAVERSPILLGVYRTEDKGTVFHRVGYVENRTDVDDVSFTDNVDDAAWQSLPTLYTTGGVLENAPPPSANIITAHRNRLWAVNADRPLELWYSKRIGPGIPVEFSADLSTQVDPRGGPVTAIASLDDKLVIFKEASIFALAGEGPNDLGLNNDFGDALLVTTDSGCINPRSIASTPEGLIFQSHKGFRLLTRALTVVDIGADVEAYKHDRVTGSALCEGVSQIRLTLASGVALVFDYEAGQWSVFTPIRAVDATLWQGQFCYLRADGTVLVEDPTRFDDDGSHIRLRLKTSWLQFAQMQGFQRVYKALVLGAMKSAHKLRVKLAYDFDATPTQTLDVVPSDAGAYGAQDYGQGVYGGDFQLYQWRVNPARQKCQALQITLEDVVDPEAGPGQSMSLTGITFEVGTKGLNKVGASRTAE